MTDMQTLFQTIKTLKPHELETLKTYIEEQLEEQPIQHRIFNMHPGAMSMSDDFDTPLPYEFWFGRGN